MKNAVKIVEHAQHKLTITNQSVTIFGSLAYVTYVNNFKMATAKKKRVSKRSKKSWRKSSDIKDVDNFLEDQRLEERLGIKYSEQKDDDLFQIDTIGGHENVEPKDEQVSIKFKSKSFVGSSKRLVETETPKCFEALTKRSAVPPHIINKSKIKPKEPKTKLGRNMLKRKHKLEILKEKKNNIQKEKERRSLERKKLKKGGGLYDIWSTEDNRKDLNGCSTWVKDETITHNLNSTGQLVKKVPKTMRSKTSLLPAIELPHPGLSYNPSLKDHSDILNKVVEAEMDLIKKEEHLERVTTGMFKKVPQHKLEQQWISEMTVGLSMSKTESDEEDGDVYKAVNPPVKNKKKTLQKRRKMREALLLKEKQKREKLEKKKLSDIYRLRQFQKDLNEKEEKIMKNIEKRKELKKKKPFTTKLLSHIKYKEPELDFNLAEELSGNLRNIAIEGNILFDRFKSLQKRNILEPTLKRHGKKKKMKKYERDHTKMGWEPKGY